MKSSLILIVLCALALAAIAEEPPLPEGLDGQAESSDEPELPEGLDDQPAPDDPAPPDLKPALELPFDLGGFWDTRGGIRTGSDPAQRDLSIAESRLQLKLARDVNRVGFHVTSDFLYDPIPEHHSVDIDTGRGWIDLREANVSLTPASFLDLKLGRQILTWGTGDLLFINDLFPKDWNSFFIGRDQEYLKAPSDAVKASLFFEQANLDIVYTPRFDSDRFIDGSRLSYFNGTLGGTAGRDAIVQADRPHSDELAARLYRNLGGYELALYGYDGYWKSPAGQDPATMRATFPRLGVYGGSVRGKLGRGIGNIEAGWYDSKDDRDGSDPYVRNSEARVLTGYEQEIGPDLTAGLQYYVEHMLDYAEYKKSSAGPPADENHHVVTLRLTKLLMNQNLRLSLFTFFSPSDSDAYLRPAADYKISDNWSVAAGGNFFLGESRRTFFGQFQDNSNVYAAMRYSF